MTTRKVTYNVSEVMELLGVSRPTLLKMIDDGTIKCGRPPGGHRRFDKDEVERVRELLTGVANSNVYETT